MKRKLEAAHSIQLGGTHASGGTRYSIPRGGGLRFGSGTDDASAADVCAASSCSLRLLRRGL